MDRAGFVEGENCLRFWGRYFMKTSVVVCCHNNEIKYAVRVGGEMCICCLVRYFIGTALLVGM